MQAHADPLFSSDPIGFIKFVGSIFVALSPLILFVVLWLKRGPDQRIDTLKIDVEGIGEKLDRIGREQIADREKMSSLQSDMSVSKQDRTNLHVGLAKMETAMEKLEQVITNQQRDIMEAIRATSEAHMKAVHQVELEVARLGERSDLAACMKDVGDQLERSMKAILEQNIRGHR